MPTLTITGSISQKTSQWPHSLLNSQPLTHPAWCPIPHKLFLTLLAQAFSRKLYHCFVINHTPHTDIQSPCMVIFPVHFATAQSRGPQQHLAVYVTSSMEPSFSGLVTKWSRPWYTFFSAVTHWWSVFLGWERANREVTVTLHMFHI